jgi:hypothetical protein
VLVKVIAPDGALRRVTLELRRGKRLRVRATLARADGTPRRLVLRRRGGRKFPAGRYRLVVRQGGTVLLRRNVRLRKTGPQANAS